MISEFQRLLMVNTSVQQSFKHNLRQVSSAIMAIARDKKVFRRENKEFLDILDDSNVEEEAVDSLGK